MSSPLPAWSLQPPISLAVAPPHNYHLRGGVAAGGFFRALLSVAGTSPAAQLLQLHPATAASPLVDGGIDSFQTKEDVSI